MLLVTIITETIIYLGNQASNRPTQSATPLILSLGYVESKEDLQWNGDFTSLSHRFDHHHNALHESSQFNM